MADGHHMRAGTTDSTSGRPLSLDEAIARLEAGVSEEEAATLVVDIGEGRLARADGPRGAAGLLQRLRGHRMLMALAEGAGSLPRLPASERVTVTPEVQEILDAANAKR